MRAVLRGLRRTPAFAIATVLILALGIGLATAVFTVADGVLLRRLPIRDQDRLVVVWGESRDGRFANWPLDLADSREFASRARSLESVAFVLYQGAWPATIRDGTRVSRLREAFVSGAFFDVLGAHALLGRALEPSDDVPGAAPVVVLSYAVWQQRYAGDPGILGHQLQLYDGRSYTIVGVMPHGLVYPAGAEFWAPVVPSLPEAAVALTAVGRLRPSATLADAREDMTAFYRRPGASASERELRGVVHSLPRLIVGDVRPAVIVFSIACALLLLVTCVNVANLLLVRGIARAPEIAMRYALGASRRRVLAALIGESVLLGLGGGALGVLVAIAAVRSFVAFAPPDLPRLGEIHINATVLAGAVLITSIATLLFAIVPGVATSRLDPARVLQARGRTGGDRRMRRLGEGLAAGQIALALLLLSTAGLIARSFINLERVDLEVDASHVLIGELAVRADQFDNGAKQTALLERLMGEIRAVPGVRGVSPVVAVPFSGTGGWEGHVTVDTASPIVNIEVISPEYLTTFGIPVVGGRNFTDADRQGTLPVALVSRSTAQRLWPGADPIGKRMGGATDSPPLTVVGVVPDTRYRDLKTAWPSIYIPLRQSTFRFAPSNLAIRTSGSPSDMIPTIRRLIAETDPGVALASAASFDTFLAEPLAQPRLNALLLSVFAGAAVVLAAVGLFGVMATMVRQRTRELGVRMALGATAREVHQMVMRRGLAIAAIGCALGLPASLAANRLTRAMLYHVSPTDPLTLAIVAISVLSIAALAVAIPAWSSTRIEVTTALRADP